MQVVLEDDALSVRDEDQRTFLVDFGRGELVSECTVGDIAGLNFSSVSCTRSLFHLCVFPPLSSMISSGMALAAI